MSEWKFWLALATLFFFGPATTLGASMMFVFESSALLSFVYLCLLVTGVLSSYFSYRWFVEAA